MRSGYPQLGHALQSVKTTVEANALAFPWTLCGKAVDAPVLTEEGYCLQYGSLKANSTHSVECLIYLSQIVAYHGLNLRRQGPYKANVYLKPGPKKLKQIPTSKKRKHMIMTIKILVMFSSNFAVTIFRQRVILLKFKSSWLPNVSWESLPQFA